MTTLLLVLTASFVAAVALLCWVLPSRDADLAAIQEVRSRRDAREEASP